MFLVKALSILASTDESVLIFLANFLSQDIKMTGSIPRRDKNIFLSHPYIQTGCETDSGS
jgi:hypothetical protein